MGALRSGHGLELALSSIQYCVQAYDFSLKICRKLPRLILTLSVKDKLLQLSSVQVIVSNFVYAGDS